MPEGLIIWMMTTSENIRLLEQGKLKAPKTIADDIAKKWKSYTLKSIAPGEGGVGGGCNTTTTTVGPLISATWGQDRDFNSLCPLVPDRDDDRALAGCVTVALAQIMYHHQHPNLYNWSSMSAGSSCTGDTPLLMSDIFDLVIKKLRRRTFFGN